MKNQKFFTLKKILIALLLCISANQSIAQNSNGIFFQAVARDNFSNPAKDRNIYVESSILQTTVNGTKVLVELHKTKTDAMGVFNITIGNGQRTGGSSTSIATIDWSKGPFYLNLKIAITPFSASDSWDYSKELVDIGTTSFGAVPFAFYSASSAKVSDKLDATDTTKMLAVYAKAMAVQSLATDVSTKLTAADTLTMLAPYAKAAYTIDSNFFRSQLATKLNIVDTINYTKQKYTDSAFSKKLNIADSSSYVTPSKLAANLFDQTPLKNEIATKLNIADSTKYITPTQLAAKTFDQTPITNAIATKLNIADSTKYITPTQLAAKTFDTTSLSNRINLKLNTAQIGAVNGVASLDASGLIPSSQLPPISFTSTTVVSNDVDMIALSSATVGSIAIRTDLNKNFVLSTLPASTLANWVELLTPAAPVQTVNGYTGSVNLSKNDIDLSNVDNTSDITKPVSNPTKAALDLKLDASKVGAASGVASLNILGKIPTDQIPSISFSTVKVLASEAEMLALSSAVIGSVVIRTDLNKNYVLAQANPAVLTNWIQLLTPAPPVQTVNGMTGDILITKSSIDLTNVNNTSDASKPVSTATLTALGAKADTAVVNPSLLLKAPLVSPKFTGSVAIGTSIPAASAALDITSTTQGLLLPRLTYVQKTAIVNPVAGLILFCSDCGTNGEMQLYNGTSFVNMIGATAQFAMPGISSTTAISAITTSTANSGGVINSDGGAAVTARGIVWGTSTAPTIALVTKTTNETGVGTFTSAMSSLTSGVTYYVRAYATNSVGTKYASEISFNTSQAVATLAATTTVSAIGSTTATSGGNITYNGGATVTTSGVVWSTTSTPTIELSTKTTNVAANGSYTSSITGLTPGTLYYVRSYATNSVGTNYGAQTSFTTLNTATISATASAISITSSTATIGGTITADGGAAVTARGVVYGTTTGSATFSVTSGTGTGTYIIVLTGLTPATTYYARSFVTNSVGTVYGTETSFATLAIAPSLTTIAASSITKYAASAGGTITSNGGSAITASGICWSTTSTPTTSNSKTTDGTTSGSFTSTITGLTAGTTYFVRAYATNAIGTGYGPNESFTTLSTSSNNPILAATNTATSITANSAILGGNVTDEGATQVSARGLVYGTTTGASTYSVTLGSGAGTFTSALTGLTQGTTYYVRSFATNVQGTGYGTETSFTTQTTPTVSVTATPTSITTASAVGGGTISSTGGATITTSGLVWGASLNPEITLTTKTTDGTTSGIFTSSIIGLSQGTTYHVRAYATNYIGTTYGPDITFTTITTPTVSVTATVYSITGSTATGGGTISTDGGVSVTVRGLVWGKSTGSSTYSVTTGTGTGTYTSSLTGLTPATIYYVRAFATNSIGTVYGTETNFTTLAVVPTLASTETATSITTTTTISGGNITDNGGATVTTSGLVWSTTTNPTIPSATKTTDGTSSGIFTSSLTGLTAATTYYVRSYATNSVGTNYGTQTSFTTLAQAPSVSATATVTSITGTTASSGGTITSDGGSSVTIRGLVWGISSGASTYSATTGTGAGTYTASLTGLSFATTYFVRAFATNSVGTVYGPEVSFATPTTATLSSTITSTITITSAILGGVLSSNGGATTKVGIMYSTSSSFGTSTSTTINSNAIAGTYTTTITGLSGATSYYAKSYATNTAGTTYGPTISFTTNEADKILGQIYGGGAVFYILKSGDPGYDANVQHGLILAPIGLGKMNWNTDNRTTGATGTALGTGVSNTNLIIASQGGALTNSAAGKARAYNGGGYTDWYLGSLEEMKKLNSEWSWGNALPVEYKYSEPPFAYWTSSESSTNNAQAYRKNIGSADQYTETKNSQSWSVTAIRSF
jgi:hypothetical protein